MGKLLIFKDKEKIDEIEYNHRIRQDKAREKRCLEFKLEGKLVYEIKFEDFKSFEYTKDKTYIFLN